MTIKVFSMFSGIGGFEYGMIQSQHDFEIVAHCEIDKYANSIYDKRFYKDNDPEFRKKYWSRNYGDATKIDPRALPNFDLLVAGFPCQAFSVAGLRQGLDDTRGTLFFDIARILDNKRPRHFLLENVKGLLSHNRGETFQTILKVLTDLGYDVEWEILNSKNFGVPQNRERVYIIGHLGGGSGRKIFPFQRDGAEINE